MTMDIHALVGAYVLDAVDDIERAAFDRHLGTCRACSAEVDELRETAARLADATWSVPPPSLRRDVMARIAVTRQTAPRHAVPVRARPAWGRRLLAAAAAVVLAAGTGAAAYTYQERRLRDERIAAEAARAQAALVEALLTAPDATLRTTDLAGGGQVTVVVSAERNQGMVMMTDGAPLAEDQAYQLWRISGSGAPVSAGTMPAGTSSGSQVISSVRDTDVLAVTVEPASGSTAPTSPVKAQVRL